jgi:hypothetical protein
VFQGRAEVVVSAEQDQIVLDTELDEYCIDGSDLDAVIAARVSNRCGFNMVLAVRLEKSKLRKLVN